MKSVISKVFSCGASIASMEKLVSNMEAMAVRIGGAFDN